MDDEELIRRMAEGDEDALRVLYERHVAECISVAQKIVNDRGAAEDVVQNAFVLLWNEPSRYDSERGAVPAMLRNWVRNRAIDASRREGAYVRAKLRAGSDPIHKVLDPITRADRTGLENAMAGLPSEQRTLLEKMYYEGQTQKAIAEDTGIALGTVKSRIRLGMERLRAAFKDSLPRFRGQGKSAE